MKAFSFLLMAALCCLAFRSPAQSVPPLINYQGQIQNPDGTAPPTANYTLTFRIYDAATGGNVIWGPQIFDGVGGAGHGPRIPVVQGYFNVLLGPTDTTSRSLANAFDASSRFIEITVSNRPSIAPRQQLLSGPFALKAGFADRSSTALLASNSLNLAGYDWSSILVSGNNPALGQIAGGKIQPGSISTLQIAAGTITSNNLSAQLVQDALTPPGTIVAYGGINIPNGWLLCDGNELPRTGTYARLFAAIDTAWGSSSGTTFRVPDLRGVFLRGVTEGRGDQFADPESNFPQRNNAYNGGNTGNQVGSFQKDAFQGHRHSSQGQWFSTGFNPHNVISTAGSTGGVIQPDTGDPIVDGSHGTPRTGFETRPSNAYVKYLINY